MVRLPKGIRWEKWQQRWDPGFQDHEGDGGYWGRFLLQQFEMPDRQGIEHEVVAKSLCKGGEQRILKDSSLLIVWSSRFRK